MGLLSAVRSLPKKKSNNLQRSKKPGSEKLPPDRCDARMRFGTRTRDQICILKIIHRTYFVFMIHMKYKNTTPRLYVISYLRPAVEGRLGRVSFRHHDHESLHRTLARLYQQLYDSVEVG